MFSCSVSSTSKTIIHVLSNELRDYESIMARVSSGLNKSEHLNAHGLLLTLVLV